MDCRASPSWRLPPSRGTPAALPKLQSSPSPAATSPSSKFVGLVNGRVRVPSKIVSGSAYELLSISLLASKQASTNLREYCIFLVKIILDYPASLFRLTVQILGDAALSSVTHTEIQYLSTESKRGTANIAIEQTAEFLRICRIPSPSHARTFRGAVDQASECPAEKFLMMGMERDFGTRRGLWVGVFIGGILYHCFGPCTKHHTPLGACTMHHFQFCTNLFWSRHQKSGA